MIENVITFLSLKNSHYKTISTYCLEDKKLTLKAKGLHTYILSRPKNWKASFQFLVDSSEDGPTSIQSGINELRDNGYLFKLIKRENGRIAHSGYAITEEKTTEEKVRELVSKNGEGWIVVKKTDSKISCRAGNLRVCNSAFQKTGLTTNTSVLLHNTDYIEEGEKNNLSPKSYPPSESKLLERDGSGSRGLPSEEPDVSSNSTRLAIAKDPDSLKPKQAKVNVPLSTREIIDFWNSLGLKKTKEFNIDGRITKGFKRILENTSSLHNGSLSNSDPLFSFLKGKKVSVDQVKSIVERFAKSDERKMSNYKILSLGEFIFNPFAFGSKGKSLYAFFERGQEPFLEENTDPDMVTAFKRFYRIEVLGGIKPVYKIEEENAFRMAAKKTSEFFEKNAHRMNLASTDSPNQLVDLVCQAIKLSAGEDISRVSPGWFSSDVTFNRRLPSYLKHEGMIGA